MSFTTLEEELRAINADAPCAQNGRISREISIQVNDERIVIPERAEVHFLPRTCKGRKVRDWNRATVFLGDEMQGASLQICPNGKDGFTVTYRSGKRLRPAGYSARHGRYTGSGANVEPMISVY